MADASHRNIVSLFYQSIFEYKYKNALHKIGSWGHNRSNTLKDLLYLILKSENQSPKLGLGLLAARPPQRRLDSNGIIPGLSKFETEVGLTRCVWALRMC